MRTNCTFQPALAPLPRMTAIGIFIVTVNPPAYDVPSEVQVGAYAVFSDEYWKCVPLDVAANW